MGCKILTSSQLKKKEERRLRILKRKEAEEKYKKWRSDIYQRDNNICMCCNKDLSCVNPHNKQAHHILDKKNYKELMLDLNNGVLLCYYCHKMSPLSPHMSSLAFVEVLKVKKPYQYEYLLEFLKKKSLASSH